MCKSIIELHKQRYEIVKSEIEIFRTVVDRGAASFYRWAREVGINIA